MSQPPLSRRFPVFLNPRWLEVPNLKFLFRSSLLFYLRPEPRLKGCHLCLQLKEISQPYPHYLNQEPLLLCPGRLGQ